jgi:hypothetical protein
LCLLCVLLGRGPSNGPIPCPEESHRQCCDWDEENLTCGGLGSRWLIRVKTLVLFSKTKVAF